MQGLSGHQRRGLPSRPRCSACRHCLYASDAPADWQWAHPGVEEAIADEVLLGVGVDVESGETG
jgi:hypothetical protein